MKEEVIRQTLRRQYVTALASDKQIVLDAYLDGSGTARYEFLQLEFDSFNDRYFEALMELKNEDDQVPAENPRRRKGRAASPENEKENSSKRKRPRRG